MKATSFQATKQNRNTNKLFKLISLMCILFLFAACAKKNPYAKKLNELYKEQMPMYEQISVSIYDTVFSYTLTDSVNMLQDSVAKLERINDYYLNHQKDCYAKQAELYVEKARTLWWLRSSYDHLIDSYETMINDAQTKIDKNRAIIVTDSLMIHEMDSLIHATTRPDSVTFVVVNHEYNCGGGSVYERVYFNNDLEIYKTEYYEE